MPHIRHCWPPTAQRRLRRGKGLQKSSENPGVISPRKEIFMPRKRKPPTLRTGQVINYLTNVDLVLEHFAHTDAAPCDFGDIIGLRRIGKTLLTTLTSGGGVVIIPPVAQPSG